MWGWVCVWQSQHSGPGPLFSEGSRYVVNHPNPKPTGSTKSVCQSLIGIQAFCRGFDQAWQQGGGGHARALTSEVWGIFCGAVLQLRYPRLFKAPRTVQDASTPRLKAESLIYVLMYPKRIDIGRRLAVLVGRAGVYVEDFPKHMLAVLL